MGMIDDMAGRASEEVEKMKAKSEAVAQENKQKAEQEKKDLLDAAHADDEIHFEQG